MFGTLLSGWQHGLVGLGWVGLGGAGLGGVGLGGVGLGGYVHTVIDSVFIR